MARVLVIGDTHAPGMKTGYVRFLQRIADAYEINRVVHIGDLVDWASICLMPSPQEISLRIVLFLAQPPN